MRFSIMKTKGVSAYSSSRVVDPNSGGTVSTNDIGAPRSKKTETHTYPSKYGMGDYYGTGVKNPIGRVRSATVGFRPVTREQMGESPRSLA